MNFKSIKSSEYLKGIKWSVLPKNKIDTVKGQYILNTLGEEDVVAEATVKSVNIDGTNTILPVAKDIAVDITNYARNNWNGWLAPGGGRQTIETSYANVGAKYGTIDIVLKSKVPVTQGAHVVISLKGSTRKSERDIAYDSFPNNLTDIYNLVKDITEVDFNENSEGMQYSSGTVSVNPFLKRSISPGATAASSDAFVNWDAPNKTGVWPQSVGAEEGWFHPTGSEIIAVGYATGFRLKYIDRSFNIVDTFEQLDQFTFHVRLKVPVKVIAGAKSRYIQTVISTEDTWQRAGDLIGSFAFMDLIKEVNIQVYGIPVNTDPIDFEYSLDNQGELTTDVKATNTFSYVQSEFITPKTYWGTNVPWIESMTKYILDNYSKGKYIVEFDMYAHKAFEKSIRANDPIKVYQLNGLPIRRNNRDIIFFVKNIEKILEGNLFYYRVRALEESSSNVDEMKASLVYVLQGNELITPGGTNKYVMLDGQYLKVFSSVSDLSGITRLGYSVAKTSQSTIIAPYLRVPGDKIGTQIAIMMRITDGESAIDNYEIGLIDCSNGDTYVDTESDRVHIADTDDYLYTAIVNPGFASTNLAVYVKINNTPNNNTKIALNIYNMYNYNVTREEVRAWVIRNSELPVYKED